MTHRIVLVLSIFPHPDESFIVSKFLALVKNGRDVHVVCTKPDRTGWKKFPHGARVRDVQKRIHRVWSGHPAWLPCLLFPFALLRCLLNNPSGSTRYLVRGVKKYGVRILKRFCLDGQVIALRPDLVHFEAEPLAVGRADLNQLLGCRVMVSVRDTDLNISGLDRPGSHLQVWQDADGFHFPGDYLLQRALQQGFPPGKPCVLIPPVVNTKVFCSKKQKQQGSPGARGASLHILSVGQLGWEMGYEFAFQALKSLVERGILCEYRVVGFGPYWGPFAYAVHQLGLTNTVTLLGSRPPRLIRQELDWADVFLHPAVSEVPGIAVLEAQSMGLPVVCTDAGALPEIIRDGITGFVVPRRDPDALAEKLAVLAASPALRLSMGRAGRERMEKEFQPKQQVEKFDSFYRQLIRSNT